LILNVCIQSVVNNKQAQAGRRYIACMSGP